MRRRLPLTARGVGAILVATASFVIANEVRMPQLAYFGMLLLALIGVSLIWLYLPRRTDTIVRALDPDVVIVDGEATMHVHLDIRTQLPLPPTRWHDRMPRGLSALPPRHPRREWSTGLDAGSLAVFASLGAPSALAPAQHATGVLPALSSGLFGTRRTVTAHYQVYGMLRGIHTVGPFTLAATDPFGLVRRVTAIRNPASPVTVVPAVTELPALHDSSSAAGGAIDTTITHLGQGADNLIARPYLPGDSMRRIHWRATAHRDELMVRQEEQESNPEATVVLDRGVLRWSLDAMTKTGADPGFEMAVSACASVLVRLLRDGYAVEVIDSDGTVLVERLDQADPIEVNEAIRLLAAITARRDDHLTTLPRLLTGGGLGPVVIITGRMDEADVQALAPLVHWSALPMLFSAAPGPDVLVRARAHGWHVGALWPDANLAAVWAEANSTGVRHADP